MAVAFTEVVLDNAIEQDSQAVWNEVAAERAGVTPPVKPAEKPVVAPAAVEPVAEVKPDPVAEMVAKLSEFESKISGRMRNVEGHIGNLTGVQKQLREMLEAGKAAAKQSGDAPTQAEINQAVSDPTEWGDLKKDYPEWATATEKLLEARLGGNQSNFDAKAFEAKISELVEGKTKAVRMEIVDSALEAVLPNWKDEVNTPEFMKWQQAQPDDIKALAESSKVGDAAKMFRLYEKSKEVNPANQIIEQRKQTLAQATSTPKGIRTTTTQKSVADMTPAELWAYEKRQRAKGG